MGATPEQQALAALIDRAIREAGMQRQEVARLLGVHKSAVTRWCKAINEPDRDTIIKLAAITGKEPEYFMRGRGSADPYLVAIEIFSEIGRHVARGLSVPQAIVAAGGPVEQFTPQVIANMEPLADHFRQQILALAGRPWDSLSAEEQRLVLARFAEELTRRRPDAGTRGGSNSSRTPQNGPSVH